MNQATYLLINVFILSLIPSFEGRYAIIVGYTLGLHPLASYAISCLAVALLSLILPSLLPLIDDVARWMSRSRYAVVRRISELYMMYVERARVKAKPYVERYGLLGLALFVTIPLPGTGVWTASLASYLLGMERKSTIAALLIGGLASNTISLLLLAPTMLS